MVTNVSSTVDPAASAAAMKKSLGMNKDDFMKLFIAQLQYQDPLKPQDPSAMLDQLSQLSLVEQSYNSNTALNNLLTAQNNSMAMNAVSFIGKDLTAKGNAISFDGSTPASLAFNQSVPTTASTITIRDESGQVVRSVAIGAMASGDATYEWDGRDNNGIMRSAGTYNFSVSATSASGEAVAATTYTTGRITGVSLAGSTPILTVGSAPVLLTDIISVKGVS